jgi:tetratricopeptide (TPR) repeat protein
LFHEIGDQFHIAWALGDLGRVTMALGEFEQARAHLQQSIVVSVEIDSPSTTAWHLALLGHVATAMRDRQEAKQHYRRALQITVDGQVPGVDLDVLTGWATLLAQGGNKAQALEFVALALHHPPVSVAWWTDVENREKRLVAQLQAELPPDVFAAAQERGRARDLDQTVKELLVELEDATQDES